VKVDRDKQGEPRVLIGDMYRFAIHFFMDAEGQKPWLAVKGFRVNYDLTRVLPPRMNMPKGIIEFCEMQLECAHDLLRQLRKILHREEEPVVLTPKQPPPEPEASRPESPKLGASRRANPFKKAPSPSATAYR
jgi:hypothetical protein